MKKFKKYEISRSEGNLIKGGELVKIIVNDSNPCNGHPPGLYILDTETNEMWNVLGYQVQ